MFEDRRAEQARGRHSNDPRDSDLSRLSTNALMAEPLSQEDLKRIIEEGYK